MQQTHFVIDLETLGHEPTSAVASIGCVRIENLTITDTFYQRIDLQSALNVGLTVNASTIYWWLKQSEEARLEVAAPGVCLFEALLDLREFMGVSDDGNANPNALLWGNGSSFDNVIIGNAFTAHNLERPWEYRNDRDLRTLLALFPEAKSGIEFEGIRHHALHDALHEARRLIAALELHSAVPTITLPERCHPKQYPAGSQTQAVANAWNEALDEVTRLNADKATKSLEAR